MDFSQSNIKNFIIHEIGNKLRDEKLFLSSTVQIIDEELENTLLNYFLKPFIKENDFFTFNHNTTLELNEVYTYSKKLFLQEDTSNFIEFSQNIARHLYENSIHPKINRGELIVVKIGNVKYENQVLDLIGIYKSEKKDSFLKVLKKENNIDLKADQGINIAKIEKGCLILNHDESIGYKVLNIDTNETTDYWLNKFLNIKAISDDGHKTKEIIQLCKNFSNDILLSNYDKEVQISFNNEFVNYFEDNEIYHKDDLLDNVFKDKDMAKEFFDYYEVKKESYSFDINDSFELSQIDIKKEKILLENFK